LKYNLKNFPVKSSPQAYEQWKKGFEAELREKFAKAMDLTDVQDLTIRELIKEILGE